MLSILLTIELLSSSVLTSTQKLYPQQFNVVNNELQKMLRACTEKDLKAVFCVVESHRYLSVTRINKVSKNQPDKKSRERLLHLVKLLKTCAVKEPALADPRWTCEFLDPFYTETRYPASWSEHHTKEEARKAREFVASIGNTIKEHPGK